MLLSCLKAKIRTNQFQMQPWQIEKAFAKFNEKKEENQRERNKKRRREHSNGYRETKQMKYINK